MCIHYLCSGPDHNAVDLLMTNIFKLLDLWMDSNQDTQIARELREVLGSEYPDLSRVKTILEIDLSDLSLESIIQLDSIKEVMNG